MCTTCWTRSRSPSAYFHGRQRRDRRVARGLAALLERQILADHARQIPFAVLARRRSGQVEEVLHREMRDVVRARRVRAVEVLEARQLESQRRELLLDLHVGLLA